MPAESFARDGFLVLPPLIGKESCAVLVARLQELDGAAGSRDLLNREWCRELAEQLLAHPALKCLLPAGHRAIQCNFFDKWAERNWLVALHQDLSVPVAERVDSPGWSCWSVKQGQLFAQAPRTLLEDLVAVRLHLDPCGAEDGPLRVVPASHLHGIMASGTATSRRDPSGETTCIVERGGALLMRPLLLHASSKSASGRHRRVLHFVYGPSEPGPAMRWPQPALNMRC